MTQVLFKATGVSTFRNNLKKTLDDVYSKNQALIVTRPDDENVIIISERQFHELQRELNNLNYLKKLADADKEIENGDFVKFDFSEM